ncbi:hypothetical protein MNBD_NITROSPINAE04-1856 [hydrothermal vent metagenome]|uniref:Uncharacterized protein n=1 Tax=hydrothermal vent metagenome TaxID=652676 RepID=A0A3B1BY58_9ZZZZ
MGDPNFSRGNSPPAGGGVPQRERERRRQLSMGSSFRSFSIIDYKVAEADFFLQKISDCGYNFIEARYYMSAFISSTRTITYSLQAILKDHEGFSEWYKKHQAELKNDPVCSFFHNFRNVNHHIGDNVLNGGSTTDIKGKAHFWFSPTKDIRKVPAEDVETASRKYIVKIISIVFDCYLKFGPIIDAKQRYTAEYFESIGKTIEDAEEELEFPKGWTDIGDKSAIPYRWQALRDSAIGCEVNHIFQKYLGATTPMPSRLPEYQRPS